MRRDKLIPVLPKNYRRIALYAIGVASTPVVLVNGKPTDDFSERGPLTQKGIRELTDFEVRDGGSPIVGFHDHPNEMWIAECYASVASHCEEQGWLKVQARAS
jgi:hypothetical protein